ncbi:hypothetical protein BH09ACT10_BH09ACT10_18570 [soil metagenome]
MKFDDSDGLADYATDEPAVLAPTVEVKSSRAGRNLPAAIGIGLALAGAAVASLFIVKVAFLLLVMVVAAVGMLELARALRTAGIEVPLTPVLIGGGAMLVGSYVDGAETLAVALALAVLGTLVWRMSEGADGFVRDVSAGVFTLAYIPLLGSFVILMVAEDDGPWRIVAFVLVTVMSDTGGYIVGVLFGKHPMAPAISPKKSWEGFAGSLIAGTVAGILIVVLALDGRWWAGLILGVAAVLFGTLGDLCESLIKRDLGIKDMGNLLPGHGGAMDRLDSLLAVAPVAWVVMHYLVSVT